MSDEVKALLDAEYVVEGDKPVLRLFYKSGGGRSIEEVSDFVPYFYVMPHEPADGLVDSLKKMEGVRSVEGAERVYGGRGVGLLKVYTRIPRDVGVLRDEVRRLPGVGGVFEADIPFARRFLIDSGRVPMEGCEGVGLVVAAVDIEVYNPKGEPKPERDPIIMLSYSDNRGLSRVYTSKKIGGLDFVETVDGERGIIEKLVSVVAERGVDIIVGYNSDNFDFPYIKERAEKHGIVLALGADGSELRMERRGMNMGAKILGRPHVDLYLPARQTYNLPRYRLEDVYEGIFRKTKRDFDARSMASVWDSNDPEKLRELAEYSKSDADSTLEIAGVLLPLQFELSRLIRQPPYEVSRMSSSQRVETLLMVKAFERGILVPNRPGEDDIEDEEKFEGAYVVEPAKGIHDNIVLFDFLSLYPSIIISHNVDPDTMDCGCCTQGSGAHAAPNGHRFCGKKRGFIPEVLGWLVSRRVELKREWKAEKDATRKELLNVRQKALKLIANSTYGYYAFSRARWYCRECAEAITAWGREYIQNTIEAAKAGGFDVIYGDTDSIFITKPDTADVKVIVSEAKAFAKKINDSLPESMELEFDNFYPRGVFITKKRYALIGEDGKLTVKGLETRRRDWANIAKKTQERVLDSILRERDPKKAADYVMKVVADIKEGRVELRDLAINTQMTRGFGEYVQPGPHIVAAKKAMKEGMEFHEGSIITYVVTRSGSSITDRARVIDFVEEGDYDPQYYIDNQLLPAVTRILEALGYSKEELKGFGRQTSLGDW